MQIVTVKPGSKYDSFCVSFVYMQCVVCYEEKVCLVLTRCAKPYIPHGHVPACCLVCTTHIAKHTNTCPLCRAPFVVAPRDTQALYWVDVLETLKEDYLRGVQQQYNQFSEGALRDRFISHAMEEFTVWIELVRMEMVL